MRRGFTLLEAVVSIAILAVIAALTWSAVAGSLSARDLLAEQDDVQRSARITLSRLSRELELAHMTSHTTAVNTYQTVFVGKDEEPIDELWFATMAHRRLYRNSAECDQAEISIWGEQAEDLGDYYVLMHRESQRIDEKPDEDGVILPLAYDVRRLDLRYLDPSDGEWLEEWDSTSPDQMGELPRAVRIALVVMGPDPEDEDELKEYTYATTVLLRFADELKQSIFANGGGAQGLGLTF